MAVTEYPVNHPNVRKHWASEVFKEALKRTHALKFMGPTANSLIHVRDEMKKGKGDFVRTVLRMQLTGDGVAGDNTLEGNEEALTTYNDGVYLDQLRHAVRSGGEMSEQRVPFEIREEARDGLADYFATRIDKAFFNQIGSHYSQTDTRYTGSNAAITASGNDSRIYYGHSTTASLTASATGFGLTAIDICVEKAQTRTYPMRPLMVNGDQYYVLFIRPETYTALKTVVSGTSVTWYDVHSNAMRGGQIKQNPIFSGAAGVYNNTIIHVAPNLPTDVGGVAASAGLSVVPAVFCGAQAAIAAFGKNNGPSQFTWVEEFFDYENQLGVASGTIWGLKKSQYNGTDFGTIQILHTVSTAGNKA